MKKIDVIYNLYGYIDEVSDNSIHFEQENESLQINATIETDKKVRAYIKAPNNNSTVTDELTPVGGVYSCTVEGAYMAKGTMYIGFEMYDDEGYAERVEPLKIYIDSFVSLNPSASDNVYVVTVNIGKVETVDFEEAASVENVGNKKDMVLDFKIPRGERGLKGDKGNDGYTPIKGVDYFTDEDIKSLGIDDKVDKTDFNLLSEDVVYLQGIKVDMEEGKGLSSNDFTDDLKERLENNTFDGVKSPSDSFSSFENAIFKTDKGFIVQQIAYGDDDSYFGVDLYWYKDGEVYHKRNGDEEGHDNEWQKISVSQADLDNAIGDIETSLENIIEKYGLGGDAQ